MFLPPSLLVFLSPPAASSPSPSAPIRVDKLHRARKQDADGRERQGNMNVRGLGLVAAGLSVLSVTDAHGNLNLPIPRNNDAGYPVQNPYVQQQLDQA